MCTSALQTPTGINRIDKDYKIMCMLSTMQVCTFLCACHVISVCVCVCVVSVVCEMHTSSCGTFFSWAEDAETSVSNTEPTATDDTVSVATSHDQPKS